MPEAVCVTFRFACVLLTSFVLVLSGKAATFDLEECKKLFLAGDYEKVLEQTSEALRARERGEETRLLHAKALWMVGRYPEAKDSIENSRRQYYYSIRLRLLGYEVYRSAGDPETASELLDEINNLGGARRYGYRQMDDVLALGQAAVLLGADPRLVLDNFFQPVKRAAPEMREPYLAIGQLALDKHDFALAAKSYQEGLKKFPKDADMLYGLAEALAPSDRRRMLSTLEEVFETNPNHIKARLLLVDHLVDAEAYEEASEELKKIERINPNRPEMWAYRGVIAHVLSKPEEEKEARQKGLAFWKTNPVVDHILGKKLSQKYRFAEGADYQRQALKFESTYLPAKIQLAQDLLRLGHTDEGWQLAETVAKADAYDVTAYNLVTLHDTMTRFVTVTNEFFLVRMAPNEAAIYGDAAIDLLTKAREQLSRKYGIELDGTVTVEIFPEQKDFAVRTFGMPGGEGYLGVCFGNVITANSPASHTMNWQSVLWHEFCHVITLNLTRNKMPRWFSEGISVYEERRANPRWGEQMNPKYRELILEGQMKPISELSSAFMAPRTGLDLQFAYFQSSLVIEFLIEKFGLDSVRGILRDLGEGKPINEALVAHTTTMAQLEKDFIDFAKGAANALGPDTRWAKPKRDKTGEIDAAWAALHSENIYVLNESAAKLIENGDSDKAIPMLEKSIDLFPAQNTGENAYELLSAIYRKKNLPEKEREVLSDWVKVDDEAKEALLRLLELDAQSHDFERMRQHSNLLLEINPLLPESHRALGEAEEINGRDQKAIEAYKKVLLLNPPNPADLHFRLAKLFHKKGSSEARRHVLLALQDAPRFREGHQLLLEIVASEQGEKDP